MNSAEGCLEILLSKKDTDETERLARDIFYEQKVFRVAVRKPGFPDAELFAPGPTPAVPHKA